MVQLCETMETAIDEHITVPFFDNIGKQIGTIIQVMLSDVIQARVKLDSEEIIHTTIR